MQYMLLIYDAETVFADMPPEQIQRVMQEYTDFTQGIIKSGHFRAGAELNPVSTATTVRSKNGKRVTTDGPFAETREQLGGYYLVECKHLDEAIDIASRVPSVKYGGSIEVRPVKEMPAS